MKFPKVSPRLHLMSGYFGLAFGASMMTDPELGWFLAGTVVALNGAWILSERKDTQ